MNIPKKFGIIGKNISYSFSKKYFTDKFNRLMLDNHTYQVFDVENLDHIQEILNQKDFVGFNVTIPYKEKIIPFLDELSEEAEKIGAVNTIFIQNGKKIGYNTDCTGFEKSLMLFKKDFQNSGLILGNGGAAKSVKYIFDKLNIPCRVVYRKGELNFNLLSEEIVAEHKIIVQCTPVGTFPNTEDCLKFPFEGIGNQHLVIDLIYNPNYSKFIKKAADKGAKTMNGFFMLEQQAEKAWQIWNQ